MNIILKEIGRSELKLVEVGNDWNFLLLLVEIG